MAASDQQLNTAEELAAMEKKSANRLDLGSRRWVLAGAIAVYLIAMFLPFAGNASGWQFLTFTEGATTRATVTERVFVVLSFIALPILTTITAAAQRTVWAMLAWMVGSVSLVGALLGLWLRQTGTAAAEGITSGVGMYLAVASVIVVVPVLASAWLRRDPEQQRLEQLRRENTDFNPVAEVQTQAAHQAVTRTDGSTGIVDDRRQRAAERHRRAGEK